MSLSSPPHTGILSSSPHQSIPPSSSAIQAPIAPSTIPPNHHHRAHFESPQSSNTTPIMAVSPPSYGAFNATPAALSTQSPPKNHHQVMDELYRTAVKLPSAATSQNTLPIGADEYGVPLHRTLSEVVAESVAGGGVSIHGLTRDVGKGTFKGVMVPTLEFMWSVIIFIRFGYIAGEAGLIWSLVLLYSSATVSSLTVASISAIATNGVPSGGVSSVLGRSLEIVGSVQGLLQATTTHLIVDSYYWSQVLLSLACVLAIVIIVFCGEKISHLISLFFMVALAASFFAVIIGLLTPPGFPQENEHLEDRYTGFSVDTLRANLSPSDTFVTKNVFSFVFPCYVGIFTGLNRASQLKNPFISIPRGGFMSIAASTVLYTSLLLLIAATITRDALLDDMMILADIAFPRREVAIAGILLVGVGSALQCLVISSTVLETLARMQVLPGIMERLHLERPPRAIFATTCIAISLVFVRELEQLAIIVTNCFLLCYGATNFAAFLLSAFRAPSWRPLFEYHHWTISLIGCIACFGLMLYNNLGATVLVLLVCMLAGYVIFVTSEKVSFGEGLRSLLFHIALAHLASGETEEYHENVQRLSLSSFQSLQSSRIDPPKPPTAPEECRVSTLVLELQQAGKLWRPKVLAFIEKGPAGLGIQHPRMLSFISQLKSRSGLAMLVAITTASEVDRAALLQGGAATSTAGSGSRGQHHNEPPQPVPTQMKTKIESLSTSSSATWKIRLEIVEYTLLFRRVQLQRAMNDERLRGFSKSVYATSMPEAQAIVMDTLGLGELTPNTVITTFPTHHHHHHGHYHSATSTIGTNQVYHRRQSAPSLLSSAISSPTSASPSTTAGPHSEQDKQTTSVWYEFQYLMDLTARHGNTFVIIKGIDFFPSNRQRVHGSIDVWWTTQDMSGQMIPLLVGYILQQHRVWQNCSIRIFVAAHATEDKDLMEKSIRLNLALMRIAVDTLEVVGIPVPFTTHQLPMKFKSNDHAPNEDGIMSPGIDADLIEDDDTTTNDDEEVYLLTPELPASSPSHFTFAKTWGTNMQRNLTYGHKRDLFLRATTASSLKHEMESRSARTDTALVIMNVPGVDEKGVMRLNVENRGSMYMELVEYLTADMPRVVLVLPGAKAAKLLHSL
ncbi:hypothetical protein SeMB42_g05661 [Synchytrium endobioticum]|uniref:Amino acid permease/ SLC12A domain-containing protein n=1 Tax=Synchytrium endobioticum TaxID=286115 RepID=A0A507CQ14_9FUNG|nr:hypothetical protein SeMB42_g05661 [Synchytrium endobioticum]